jgi:hypothetical protein
VTLHLLINAHEIIISRVCALQTDEFHLTFTRRCNVGSLKLSRQHGLLEDVSTVPMVKFAESGCMPPISFVHDWLRR